VDLRIFTEPQQGATYDTLLTMASTAEKLGLGAGWNDVEHRANGIPFPPTGERFEMLEDQLAIVTGMWRTPVGETLAHAGKRQSVEGSPGLPKPVQRDERSGGVPIVMGGWGAKRTPRLAAQYAAEYNLPFSPAGNAADQFAIVRAACERANRDPATLTLSAAVVACCGEDEATFVRRAQAIGQDPQQLRKNQLAGTPAEVADRAAQYADAGAQRLYLQVLDLTDLDHLHVLAETLL
jgi:alkanesulfonate monooxygenase SsuD/methylene tetrahydromethanopterin reductase-like flavin-dependent oxidoreductase (luciferase family)